MTEHNGEARPTTATIDRRVERLEHAQAETDRKVDQLSLQVGYMRDLMDMKFTALESAISTNGQKLDAFMMRIEGLIAEGQKSQTDIRFTGLGRMLDDRIGALEKHMDTLVDPEFLKQRLNKLEESYNSIDDYIAQQRGVSGAVRLFLFPIVSLVIAVVSISLVIVNQ